MRPGVAVAVVQLHGCVRVRDNHADHVADVGHQQGQHSLHKEKEKGLTLTGVADSDSLNLDPAFQVNTDPGL